MASNRHRGPFHIAHNRTQRAYRIPYTAALGGATTPTVGTCAFMLRLSTKPRLANPLKLTNRELLSLRWRLGRFGSRVLMTCPACKPGRHARTVA